MDLKKILGVCLAVLLVAGFSVQADAAVATPTGVTIRVSKVDSAAWAAIDDSIIVEVFNDKGLGQRLHQVVVGIFDEDDTVTTINANSDVAAVVATNFANALTSSLVSSLSAPTDSTGGVLRFRFGFKVAAGTPTTIDASSFPDITGGIVRVAVDTVSGANETWFKLNNRSTSTSSPITSLAQRVGDGKAFGVDGERPVIGAFITNALVDTSTLVAAHDAGFAGFTDTGVQAQVKNGDTVKINLTVSSGIANAADSGVVALLPRGVTNADSALYRHTFTIVELVNAASAGNPASKSFVVAAGANGSQRRGFKNNERVVPTAYLVDQAGNLSGTTASSGVAGFSASQTLVIDSAVPTVTVTHPKNVDNPDSNRFTRGASLSVNTVSASTGALAATTFNGQPVKYKFSEPVLTNFITFNGDTAVFGQSADSNNVQTVAVDSLTGVSANRDSTGKSGTLKFVVKDSVGNEGSTSVSSVIFDPGAKPLDSFFPSSAAVDTINNETRYPVINLAEAADSISIRFVQVGASPPDVVTQSVSTTQLSNTTDDIQVTVNDTLLDDESYTLQIVFIDLAKNVVVTTPDTLVFNKQFVNPVADSFVVALASGQNDSSIVGTKASLLVTAIDTSLSNLAGSNKAAVTYEKGGALLTVHAGDQDLSTLKIAGTGVTDNGDGTAVLDGDSWVIGKRTVTINSNTVLDSIIVTVEDTSIAVVDGENVATVNFGGTSPGLTFEEAMFNRFMLSAYEDDAMTSEVSGDFQLMVVPSDSFGNASLKTDNLLTTGGSNKLDEIFVELSASLGGASTPTGAVSVAAAGTWFTVVAPDGTGDNLVLSARTANQDGADDTKYFGSLTLSFVPFGEVPSTGGELAAPDTLIVQDWMGADGSGDQGGFVLVSFPAVDANVSQYRVYREVKVTTDIVDGSLVVLETPVDKFIPWTAIDAVSGVNPIQAVVPTIDGMATRWAVAAESGANSSEQTVAGKRVFTKQVVQNMVQFLGVDPNRVLTSEELNKVFSPSKDYVASILGDREDVTFAALDPNFDAVFGTSAVPGNIRTQTTGIKTSEMVISSAVKAVDNIPPAAVTEVATSVQSQVTVTWTASTDDRTVGFTSYRGFAVPIAGVDRYEIWRGTSAETLEMIASVPAGSGSYVDADLPSGVPQLTYSVYAADLDNLVAGPSSIAVLGGRISFLAADGLPVYIIRLDGSTPFLEDFEDFVAFAQAFNATATDANFNVQADTNDDGVISFADFVAFASRFNSVAASQNGNPIPSSKPVIAPQVPGVNDNVEMTLNLGNSRVLPGETVTLNVALSNATSLQAFGFNLNYDADKFEFVSAAAAENDLLKTGGAETPIFLSHVNEAGNLSIANAVVEGSPVVGQGEVVSVTFRVLREFEEDSRFEIANGIVFDSKALANPVVAQGSLEVQSTPTEFALLQNFPNPFNPETTIKYNLADGANVQLRIYNVVGQVVRTLVSEQQGAGRYTVRWNGTDDRGIAVSSGIYFYQISAGNQFRDVRKLMLLK